MNFTYSDQERQNIWNDFKERKLEKCNELNELIVEAIKWLTKSKEAEAELEQHDHHAEERFAKLHRIRHSQVYGDILLFNKVLYVFFFNTSILLVSFFLDR